MAQVVKSMLILFLVSISFAGFVSANNDDNADKKKKKKNEETVVLQVNMDCHSCVQKIEGNIPFEKGVKDLKVSLEKLECEVTFREDKTSVDKLIEAFDKLGYKAEIKTDGEPKKTEEKEEHHGHTH
ncbi:MAG TPA: heavy metal-associated domain-containing protein [Prolixibacteraceae bacterium]|nr:heavy metal-associated domain-containing protein [Prolixibacteraceae bacterium]HPR62086.1 heavy metal-associated domain-containing protein [Prolixibacteraceae bacterium]